MKKLLGILVLGLLWCNVGFAEEIKLSCQYIKNSDFLLKIKIKKEIESLNISNSAAVVFHYIDKLRKV